MSKELQVKFPSDDEMKKIMLELDENGDGVIDIGEFEVLILQVLKYKRKLVKK